MLHACDPLVHDEKLAHVCHSLNFSCAYSNPTEEQHYLQGIPYAKLNCLCLQVIGYQQETTSSSAKRILLSSHTNALLVGQLIRTGTIVGNRGSNIRHLKQRFIDLQHLTLISYLRSRTPVKTSVQRMWRGKKKWLKDQSVQAIFKIKINSKIRLASSDGWFRV